MATDPDPICWQSQGHQHCVFTHCGGDESQQACNLRHQQAAAALQQVYPPDP